jgi:thiamine-phosphate pyrophosphorylase
MHNLRSLVRGLYAVTPEARDDAWLEQRVRQALLGGARLVQYRSKSTGAAVKLRQAQELRALCRMHGALFIVNDDAELAGLCRADGVHLGREDASIASARERLGETALIGASCYDDLARAQRCADAGADYLAFGSFFPSTVKPDAVRAPLELLHEARRRWQLPLVAIGGIRPDNASGLIAAGADALAVIGALFHVPDTHAAAQELARLFQSRSSSAAPNMPA